MSEEQIWLIIGFIGQTIFASRFLIQWVVSERASKSIIPNIFWWISLAGSMVLLSYAIHKVDPVFIVGQSCGFLIYSRNFFSTFHLLTKEKQLQAVDLNYLLLYQPQLIHMILLEQIKLILKIQINFS